MSVVNLRVCAGIQGNPFQLILRAMGPMNNKQISLPLMMSFGSCKAHNTYRLSTALPICEPYKAHIYKLKALRTSN